MVATPSPQHSPRQVRDPRELRALAHPLRMAIVEQLSVHGPATATELSELLDESPANCSWHLRKLAEHGFVEEAEGGKGRQRPWQMATIGFSSGPEGMGPDEARAQAALIESWLDRQYDRHQAANRSAVYEDDGEWTKEAVWSSDSVLWLTTDEFAMLRADIEELLQRHRERLTEPATRPKSSRLVELVVFTTPIEIPGQDRRTPMEEH